MLRTLAAKPKLARDCALDYRVSRASKREARYVTAYPSTATCKSAPQLGNSERASTVTAPLSRLHPLEEVHRKHDSHFRPGNSLSRPRRGAAIPCLCHARGYARGGAPL